MLDCIDKKWLNTPIQFYDILLTGLINELLTLRKKKESMTAECVMDLKKIGHKENFPFHIAITYIPRNMHTVFALLCFVVVIHWLIFPYPSGLLHWHCGNLTITQCQQSNPDEYG